MITAIDGFESINALSALPDGAYRLDETVYESVNGLATATFKELFQFGQAEASACDLVCVTQEGAVLFRDFMRLPNGDWRDSYGRCAEMLDYLLPSELADYGLIRQVQRNTELRAGALINSSPAANGAV